MERYYETVFILRPTLNDQEIAETIESSKNLLVREGAEMIKQEDLGKKRLAYLIKHFQNGHYVLFQYQAKPSAVRELERTFKISEDLLRYLTVRLDARPAAEPAVETTDEPATEPATEPAAEPAAVRETVEAPAGESEA